MRTIILENKIKHIMKMFAERHIHTTIEIDGKALKIDGRTIVYGPKSEMYRHLNTVESTLWLIPIPAEEV